VRYSRSGETFVEVFDDHQVISLGMGEKTKILRAELEASANLFEQKFGRPMRDGDPVLWDRNADVPQPISEAEITAIVVGFLRKAGIDDQYIFAYEVTGMLLTEENEPLFSDADLAAWDLATAFYDQFGPLVRTLVSTR
jgi:hypothetical protein